MSLPSQPDTPLFVAHVFASSLKDFSALPFQSHTGEVALNISTGFNPEFFFNVTFFDGLGGVGANAGFDAQMNVEIQQVNNVNAACEPVSGSDPQVRNNDVILIQPSVTFDGGLYASAYVDDIITTTVTFAAFSDSPTAPPTACLMFDSQASTYRAATASATTSRATRTSGATGTGGATGSSGATGTGGATGTSGATETSGAAAISSPFKRLMSNIARQALLGLTMVFTFALLVGM